MDGTYVHIEYWMMNTEFFIFCQKFNMVFYFFYFLHECSYVAKAIHFHSLTLMYDGALCLGKVLCLPVMVRHMKKLITDEKMYLYIWGKTSSAVHRIVGHPVSMPTLLLIVMMNYWSIFFCKRTVKGTVQNLIFIMYLY